MGHYVYGGTSRRIAEEVLTRAGDRLVVGVFGGAAREHDLFRSTGKVIAFAREDGDQQIDPEILGRCDAILGQTEHLGLIANALGENTARVKMLVVRGLVGSMTS